MRGRRRGMNPWFDAVRAVGLEVQSDPGDELMVLRSVPAHSTRIEVVGDPVRGGGSRWTITVEPPGLPHDLRLVPEDAVGRVKRLVVGEDLLTGDAEFDAAVHVSGDAVATLGLLSASVRDQVAALMKHGVVERGALRWIEPSDARRPPWLAQRVVRLTRLGRALAVGTDPMARLLRMARTDRKPDCRLHALEVYLGHGGHLDDDARRHLLRDTDARVRLRVGRATASVESLLALVGADDPAVRREAFEALIGQTGPTALAAFDALAGELEPALVLRAIGPCLERHPQGIATLGEPALLALLDGGARRLRDAIIERLHAIGTEAAVPALTRVADAFFGWPSQKARAREAIAAIAERCGGLRIGGLSVSEAGEGGLSLKRQ